MTLTSVLTEQLNTVNEIKTNVELNGEPFKTFKFATETIYPKVQAVVVQEKSIGGETLIWGNQSFGVWNEFKWGNIESNSFILGNEIAGVLGLNKLGSNLSEFKTIRVVPPNDTFEEEFASMYFISTSSSATVTTLATFNTTSDYLLSNIIYKNNVNISNCKVNLTVTSNVSNLGIQVSNDGSTWESANNNTIYTFLSNGEELRYKITPVPSATVPIYLTKLKIEVNK